ncbi:hypothetical protein A0J48_017090 [Sphaerospermopsis aphanizomenoides BCCUSP55]|uniref:hypothetical protein n=1 Tax=Sphaerospermopsis aphanizomenoides TaxID=459663 RepID=UPI001905BC63|nr:hypothetical protein [Sphaerospermopsis aphanizomenoides]MBK1989231.1 hypothetical protein [Sphaerospermopsis aphanizomenoides BCCUSP55]
MNVKKEELKAMILQFPVEEINELIAEIRKALEMREFMKSAETGFTEWNDPEEDIYNDETEDS